MNFVFPKWKEWPGRPWYWLEFEFVVWPKKVKTSGGKYRLAWCERILKISAINKSALTDEPSFFSALYNPVLGRCWYSDHVPDWMSGMNWLCDARTQQQAKSANPADKDRCWTWREVGDRVSEFSEVTGYPRALSDDELRSKVDGSVS